jgi:hypothetical protein
MYDALPTTLRFEAVNGPLSVTYVSVNAAVVISRVLPSTFEVNATFGVARLRIASVGRSSKLDDTVRRTHVG